MKPGKKQKFYFGLVALALLGLPLYFILRSENMLADREHLYRFRPQRLVDPHDMVRGHYLVIDFPSRVPVDSSETWTPADKNIYVIVERDSVGYARFVRGTQKQPAGSNYFTTTGSYNQHFAWIRIPFNKYFINENNALLAEKIYQREVRDTATNLYMEVSIRDGEALLKDIYLDSMPLREYMNRLSPAERREIENMTSARGFLRLK